MTAATARQRDHAIGAAPTRPHYAGFEALRALAALMVVVHHAASTVGPLAQPARPGRLLTLASVFDGGVAIFFVMSGFLLWRPVVARSLAGRAGEPARAFWWRRIVRIVPAYWSALTVLWASGVVALGGHWWRYYLFLQTYSEETVLGGIVPAWSLGTEMAFYLVLPGLAVVIGRVARGRSPGLATGLHLGFCGLLGLGGFVARAVVDRSFADRRGLAFTWLPQNLDLFAWGMALAVLSAAAGAAVAGGRLGGRLDAAGRPTACWWGGAAALFAWYAYRVGPADLVTGYTGWSWHQRQLVLGAVAVLLLVPVVFGTGAGGPLRALASWRPIAWVGLVSYGLYLWHLDVMGWLVDHDVAGLRRALARGTSADPPLLLLCAATLAVALALAAVSWYGLERPLQRRARRT